ncbi:Abortive infection bacteriophage resistance protein [gamma proteobacterium IMCC2047]|nr:Abortive infection bacteriophage resistance protein [gamma proteobacterium IMCC2047]
MLMAYNRPWKSFEDQLKLLKSRGMTVTDEDAANSYLERIGYYRLSAYWYPFRVFEITQDANTRQIKTQRTDNFVDNSQFVDAVELYIFDKKLRLLVLDALERIEVALRVDMAYLLGQKGAFSYRDINLFHPTFATKPSPQIGMNKFQSWLAKYEALLNRSKEDFVEHYRQKHGADLPIWVAVEVWDFGAMSQLFNLMKVPDQTQIASKYGVNDFKVFASWLRSLNYLRNITAHHSRLWNRNIIDQPKLPKVGEIDWCDSFIGKPDLIAKSFLLLAITRHLVNVVCPNTQWHNRLEEHLDNFPTVHSDRKVSVEDMGTPPDWQSWW